LICFLQPFFAIAPLDQIDVTVSRSLSRRYDKTGSVLFFVLKTYSDISAHLARHYQEEHLCGISDNPNPVA